ncbi:tetratricopeptide repeat protein 28-like [Dermacentor andersoni]|uniref:tetratricopeptide repeat protein 28-like n=1 Tax=Dermacentor andersoni TaxID=34620 RepID=UPI00241783D1|nr:tetratricopeptide repeat protein 28-like [Dermacentor andersoni]
MWPRVHQPRPHRNLPRSVHNAQLEVDVECCDQGSSSAASSSAGGSSSGGAASALGGAASTSSSQRAAFLDLVRQSTAACQAGDFGLAAQLYTEALALDPANHVLYSNRSAAYVRLGKYTQALQDAAKARELNPRWAKAYYRQGVALQCLGRHADALAAFASGLNQDSKSVQLLAGLVEAAMKSPLRATLEPTYRQLQSMRLDKSPFVMTSVIGQELLATGQHAAAVVLLETALHIGTCSLKLRGSVFSALSSAYWALNSIDRAIAYMQQDLAVAKSLNDQAGECRAHGNLGSAHFSKGNLKEALSSHRYQLVLAMKCKDSQAAALALTSLGHVYTAIGDYPNALASHKQCVQLVRQMGDRLQEAREVGNVGAVYLAMGDFESAVECHTEHLRLAKQLGNKVEEARAYSNLGSSHHYRRCFDQARSYHEQVLRIARELGDRVIEARAYAGLGHAARCMGDGQQARRWHEKQLDMALAARDKVAEGRACSNLGIVYQLAGHYEAALKLHQAHLNIARSLGDRAGMGRAYGNMGNAQSAMGNYEQAVQLHKQELTISKEVNDRSAEASTHGNLAVAYQALGRHEMALLHYHSHLNIARELKDAAGEACALCNLGNCYSSRGEFGQAVPYYENYLRLSEEMGDTEAQARACHFLGYAHYCLGNYKDAIDYYEKDLTLAKNLHDRINMGRAYCNLGLSHLALGNLDAAYECQKYFLALSQVSRNLQGKFRALGNMGDVLMKMGKSEEAVQMYQKQLMLVRQSKERHLEAAAYGALGLCHRQLKCYEKALGYHTQELALQQELGDVRGECLAQGRLGAVHLSLGQLGLALRCYQAQLERARQLRDCPLETQALGNLGLARLGLAHYEDAIGYFEQQLALLEQLGSSSTTLLDKGRAYGSLGECYDALGDPEEAVKCHDQYLSIAIKAQSPRDQERAYRGLGSSYRSLGNLQQALVCLEKRLVVAHEQTAESAVPGKAAAYGELGALHRQLGNYEQALACLERQMALAEDDPSLRGDAACGMGAVYQAMGAYDRALHWHQVDLEISEETNNMAAQGRAYGNLGMTHEALGNYDKAVSLQEQHLSIAAQLGDKAAKAEAYSSLGRVHHALGHVSQACSYLQQALQACEQLGGGKREEEARVRHRLGLVLWLQGDLDGAQQQLARAHDLLEALMAAVTLGEHRGTDPVVAEFLGDTAQALQRVLVSLGRQDEALLVAERSRTRSFAEHALETRRSALTASACVPNSLALLLEVVNRQKATILYFSLAAGHLLIWLMVPHKGIVKFTETPLSENQSEPLLPDKDGKLPKKASLLERHLSALRESLGVDPDTEDACQSHWDEASDRFGQDPERRSSAGFSRLGNRNHLLNSSNYSLSSLFSVGSVSVTSGPASRAGSMRAPRPHWPGPPSLHALYELLIGHAEEELSRFAGRDLLIVPDGDLYLVPFAMLRGNGSTEYLCERFSLTVLPSLSVLRAGQRAKAARQQQQHGQQRAAAFSSAAAGEQLISLIVGNPKVSPCTLEWLGCAEIPHAEQEAEMVAEILGGEPLLGADATKEMVLGRIGQAECIHIASHVSWKVPGIVLASGAEFAEDEEASGEEGGDGARPTADVLLTASDVSQMRLVARLVVLSMCHTRSSHGRVDAQSLETLAGAFLAAGAHCVLVSLWPVPDTALKILLRTFYSSLMQGSRASAALSEALCTIQTTKQFGHPANWASFALVGGDVHLSNQVVLMGQALVELLKTPDKCRDALRVVLHLVEKSLQRIQRGQKNAMYTSQKSIESKVGPVSGWKELLVAVGFRFEPAANGLPASVFFPQADPGERLVQCSTSLQALLGLSVISLSAISKLLSSPEYADDIIELMHQVVGQLGKTEQDSVECHVSVKLWSVPGCHELLASLGFDLMEVGKDEVTLRMGKQANRRSIQFALQALLAVFDTQEAPKNLNFDDSSDLDSLDSDARTDSSPPPTSALGFSSGPLTRPRLGQGTGAFSNYVRARGEPDGRTAPASDQKNRDSDTFTPSPVNPVSAAYTNLVGLVGFKPTNAALVQQGKMRTLYNNDSSPLDDSGKRPDSSSSASSDWDAGQMTVRRQNGNTSSSSSSSARAAASSENAEATPSAVSRKAPSCFESQSSDSDRNDFSLDRPRFGAGISRPPPPPLATPRTSLGSQSKQSSRRLKQTMNAEQQEPCIEMNTLLSPTCGNGEGPAQRDRSMRDHILSHQMRHFSRAPPISDVYHDRNLGLGLAPSLSKILADDGGKLLSERAEENGTVEAIRSSSPPPLVSRRCKPPPPPPKIAAKPHRLQKGRIGDIIRGAVGESNGFALTLDAEKTNVAEERKPSSESSDDGSSQNRDAVSTVRRKPKSIGTDDGSQTAVSEC